MIIENHEVADHRKSNEIWRVPIREENQKYQKFMFESSGRT